MDNSHDDFAPVSSRKGVNKRFKQKDKVRTVVNSDGSEKIVALKKGNTQRVAVIKPKPQPTYKVKAGKFGNDQIVKVEPKQTSQPIQKREQMKKRVSTKKTKSPVRTALIKIGKTLSGKKRTTKKPKTVGHEALKFIEPLVPSMKKGLAMKGYATNGMTYEATVEKFYNEFVSKKGDKMSNYDELPEGTLENHYLFSADYDTFDSDNLVGLADVQSLVNIGKGVAGKFKQFKEKRKAKKEAAKTGQQVAIPKVENTLGADAERIMKELEAKQMGEKVVTQAEADKKQKNILKYVLFGVAGVAFIGLLIYLIKRK